MRDSFWRRWAEEYLHHLQQRSKWKEKQPNLQPGNLMRDDLLLPTKWALGRITEVFPGPDGLVHVASVCIATSELRRPIVRLCSLPIASTTGIPRRDSAANRSDTDLSFDFGALLKTNFYILKTGEILSQSLSHVLSPLR